MIRIANKSNYQQLRSIKQISNQANRLSYKRSIEYRGKNSSEPKTNPECLAEFKIRPLCEEHEAKGGIALCTNDEGEHPFESNPFISSLKYVFFFDKKKRTTEWINQK